MADNPDARPPEGLIIPVSDTPHAPFIFYEIAPAFGFTNGVVNVTLSANRYWVRAERPRARASGARRFLSGRRCEFSTIGPGQNLSSARVEP